MPCHSDYDDRPPSFDSIAAARFREQAVTALDSLTRMLCSCCKVMTGEQMETVGTEVQYWWIEHQMLDAQREAVDA